MIQQLEAVHTAVDGAIQFVALFFVIAIGLVAAGYFVCWVIDLVRGRSGIRRDLKPEARHPILEGIALGGFIFGMFQPYREYQSLNWAFIAASTFVFMVILTFRPEKQLPERLLPLNSGD